MNDILHEPLFLDYESSSLWADSYPIEAGYSRLDLPEPISFLIRPHESWRSCIWDANSETVHGIPEILLDAEGVATEEACRRLAAATEGRTVISDYPLVETQWSERLFDAHGLRVPFVVHDFGDYLWHRAEAEGIDPMEAHFVMHAHAHRFKTVHRAGPDSFRMTEVVRATVDRNFRDSLFGRKGYGTNWAADMQDLQ
jgi:hypothetical protein